MLQMIADKFLDDNKTDNWDWIKSLTREDLEYEVRQLCPNIKFKTKPYKHQLACFLLGIYNPNFIYLCDMGTGKSAVMLYLINHYKSKALIITPTKVSARSWEKEVEKHSNLTYQSLLGTKKERLSNTKKTDVSIINYQGLPVFCCRKIKRKNYVDDAMIDDFMRFDFICLDESHIYLRNRNSLTFKILVKLNKKISNVYLLTGTPINRDPAHIWPQYKLVDDGFSLGNSLSFFRNVFFTSKLNYWGGMDFKVKPGMTKVLKERMKHRTIRYSEEEVSDLPKRINIKKEIQFPKENFKSYMQAVEGLIDCKGDFKSIDNAFIRLRQICAGFMSFKNEDDERVIYKFRANPKLDAVIDIVKETPPDSKVVIFNWFIPSGDIIEERLKKDKITYRRLYGKTKNQDEVYDDFLGDKTIKVFLANSQSGGTGLNLQVANYCIFYESPITHYERKQALKRVHRGGQEKRVFIIDTIMQDSIENKVLKYCKEGRDIFKELFETKNRKEFLLSP